MNLDIPALRDTVQFNCHLSDAQYAAEYPLCIYLLKMREYFRWEQGIDLGKPLDKQALGEWLTQREAYWDDLGQQAWREIRINNECFDAFDSDAINAALESHSLVYSAGMGVRCKPHFFLGRLREIRRLPQATIYIAGDEYARELTAPPAMSLKSVIFVRFQSLRRMVWEKIEEWMWHKNDSPMGRLVATLPQDFVQKLDSVAEQQLEILIQHELGETQSGQILQEKWQDMILELSTKQELFARAVRDNLADCLSTLPYLLEVNSAQQYHFYMASLSPLRKEIFPSLVQAYDHWYKSGDSRKFESVVNHGKEYWRSAGEKLLSCYLAQDSSWQQDFSHILEQCRC